MDDGMTFFEFDAQRADRTRPVVSPTALDVHVGVVNHLAHTTRGHYVGDHALDAVAPGPVTTMAAIELCLAGWWRRLDGGYVIVDQELVDAMSHGPGWQRVAARCRRLWKTLNSETVIPL